MTAPAVPLLLFFGLTYALSWALWGAAAAIRADAGFALSAPAGYAVFLLGVFAPALVALALTARADGPTGVRALLGRMLIAPPGVRWFLFAAGYMAAIKLAAALLHRLATGAWPTFGTTPLILMLGAMLISTPVQAGEEVGWRGYALPRLAERFGLGPASLVLGVLWAAWHLPIFSLPGADTYGQSFTLYLIGVTAISVAMAWLWWRTGGSLLLTMLMHAAVNNTKDIVPSGVAAGDRALALGGSLTGWLAAGLLWICAAWFLTRMTGAALPAPLVPVAADPSSA